MSNSLEKTKEQIVRDLEWKPGDELSLSALIDIAIEEDDEDRAADLTLARHCARLVEIEHKKMRILKSQHDVANQEYKEKLCQIRSTCSHPVTKYYPDGSGGGDSTTRCLCCGKHI